MARNFYFKLLFFLSLTLFSSHLAFSQCTVIIAPSSAAICNGSSVVLTASGATTYSWTPVTGLSNPNIANPTASPIVTTSYVVTGDCGGPIGKDTIIVTVYPLPNVPSFSYSPSGSQCAGTLITFTVTSPQLGVTYTWTFGDGNTGTGTSVSHSYSTIGNGTISYNVIVTATNGNGCTSTSTSAIQVKQIPDATLVDYNNLPPFTHCSGGLFDLTVDNGSSTISTNTNYTISWGDGAADFTTTSFISTTHTYITLGYFDLVFTVIGSNGCTASTTYQVYNGSNPAGGLGSPGSTIGLCPPATLVFPITGVLGNAPGTIYILTSNDGSPPDTFQHPPPATYSHTFYNTSCGATGGSIPNSFYVRLTIQNPCGFTISTIEPITINEPPVANFTISPDTIVCVNTNVTFTNTTQDAVYVSNSGVCDSTTKINWVVSPSSGWSIVSGALGIDPPTSNPSTWGTDVLILNFSVPGIYTIELQTSSTLNSCGESIKSRTVCVNPIPISIFSLSAVSGCSPLSTTANNTSPPPYCGQNIYTWTVSYSGSSCPPNTSNWQFTGGTNASSTNPTFQFINAGTYTINLSVDNLGCNPISSSTTVDVKTVPVVTLNSIPSICAGQSVSPTAIVYNCYATTGPTYSWSFPGGSPSTSTSAIPGAITYAAGGTYTITLMVTNECGSTTVTQTVTVIALPIANAEPDVTICSGQSATLTASGGLTYLWNTGATTASITVTPATTTTYTVTVSNGSGCSATDVVQVIVNPSPIANAGADVSICPGASTTLTATGGVSYLWSTGATTASITVSPANTTTYTVTVTAANGCTASDAVVVTIYSLPLANAGPDVSICIGQSTTLTATGGVSYLWSTGATTASITVNPSVTTTYTVTVTSNVGCTASDQVQVTVLALPIADAGPDVTICSGQSATLTASGGLTYLWNTGATTASITVTPAITTTYTVTVSNGSGCSATDVVQVIVNPSPIANAGADVSICPGASTTLTATGGVSYLWNTGATTASITVSPANTTTYTVTVTAANGCTASDAVVVTIYPLPVANAGPDVSICIGQSTTLTATGGVSYLWSTGATTASITVNPSVTTTYTVTVTSNVGCTASDQVQVTVLALPIANAGPDVTICSGQSATLTASGGLTYLWNTGATTASITVTPATTTTYTVTVSNGSGCSATDVVQVIVNPSPIANAGADVSICPGASTTLTATGGVSYLWSTGATTASITVSPANTTTYTVTVTAANGCTASDAVVVTIYSLPLANAGPDVSICIGQSTTLTATGGVSYLWSTGATTASITVNPSVTTTYTVTVTSNVGCTASDQVQVTVLALPIADAGPDVTICSGQSATLTASGGLTYLWNTGATTASITVTPAITTTYTVTVSNGSGCSATDVVQVIVNPSPIANAGADVSICPGASTTLTATGGVSYLWNTGATTASITVSPANTTTYTVTVTAANGCTASDAVVVTIYPLPVANAGPDVSICIGQSTTLTATGGVSYLWSTGATTASITVNPSVTTTYTVTVTSNVGCTASDQVQVTVLALPIANAGPDVTICSGQSATLTASGGLTYLWNTGATTASITVTPATTTTYTVTVSNGSGCSATDVVQVIVNPSPIANAGADVSICPGASTTLTATGGVSYLWSTGATTASITVSPANTTTYTVTVTAANGCTASDAVVVTIYSLPLANAGPDVSICIGQSTTLTATGGVSYLWSTGATTASITVNPSVTTTYTVTVTSNVGCTASDQVQVTVLALPIADAGPDVTICSGQSATLTASGGLTYLWNTGATTASITVTPAITTTYTVTVSNGSGCSATDVVQVIVNPSPTVTVNSPTICIGETTTMTATGGSTYLWNTGETSSSITVSPTSTTTYTVTVTNSFGCTASATPTVTVHPLPIPEFNIDSVGCINLPFSFQNLTTGATNYLWNFGDGWTSSLVNPSHLYSSIGTYQVTLVATSSAGCIDSISHSVFITQLSPVSFTMSIDSGCGPLSVSFNPVSGGFGINYHWNFGNGMTSNQLDPGTIIFQSNPNTDTTYFITFTASNLCDTLVYLDSVKVIPLPTAYFGININSGCSPVQIFFSNNSFGLPTSFLWDFGDGTTSTSQLPGTHYYYTGSSDTTYYITLTATNQCGSSVWIDSVHVLPNMVNAFINANPISGCEPLTVFFTNFTVGATNYFWDFGDGNISNLFSPTHIYSDSGTFNIFMIATDGCGIDTAFTSITVYPHPIVLFSVSQDTICSGHSITFTNLSQNLSSVIWFFGDGTTSTQYNPVHTYSSPGQDTVILIGAMQNTGCPDTAIHIVTILPSPVSLFTFTPADGCQPLNVTFTNSSSNSSYQIWNFGDGNSSIVNSPVYTYTDSGQYTVTLISFNNIGCSDTASALINVYPTPSAAFLVSQDSSCFFPVTIQLTNTSVGAYGYSWDFGNGQTSSLFNPAPVTYNALGTYQIILIASNQYGCSDTAKFNFNVYPNPIASFDFGPFEGCEPLTVTFNNTAQYGMTYYWNFGNGDTSSQSNPTYTYTSAGQYTPFVIVTGAGGCTDMMSSATSITVFPTPTAGFSYQTFNLAAPNAIVSFFNSSNDADSYQWYFGDGSSSTEINPTHTYSTNDTFEVILIASNMYGCSDTAFDLIVVKFEYGLYVPNALTPGYGPIEDQVFTPKGVGLKSYHIWIYDTWGNMLWESDKLTETGSPAESWTGYFKGQLLPQDVYVWKIQAVFQNEQIWGGKDYPKEHTKPTGTVTLVR